MRYAIWGYGGKELGLVAIWWQRVGGSCCDMVAEGNGSCCDMVAEGNGSCCDMV